MCKIQNDFGAGDQPTQLGAAPHIWRHVHGREQAEITLVNGYNGTIDGFIRNVRSCLRRSQAEFEAGELSCCHAINLVLVVY